MGKSKKPTLLIIAAMSVLSLSSCTIYSFFPGSSSSSSSTITSESTSDFAKEIVSEGVYKSTDFLKTSARQVSAQRGMDLVPSTGNVKILVLPIEFTDSPFSESTLGNIEKALNGTDNDYWESTASFYEKSSYGKLHLNFHVADTYKTGITSSEAAKRNYEYSQNGNDEKTSGQAFVNEAVSAYKDADFPLADFDSDDNGIIDGIVAIYSCPNYRKKTCSFDYGGKTRKDDSLFWAYTYWCVNDPDLSSPKANTYIWISYDFFAEGGDADAHTLIHEFGHTMGLDDYYSGEVDFQPAGGIDMMDLNIADHDAYSKCVLGWTFPYIVDGDEVSLTIRPSQSSGDCVLIPTSAFNGTVWDEYILLELYTPDGLNELDTKTAYCNEYPRGYSEPGIKIYHIDSRLISCYSFGSRYTSTPYVSDPNSIDLDSGNVFYFVGATNCSKEFNSSLVLSSNRSYSEDFSLLHLIEATGKNTFKYGDVGTNATLFKEGSSFSLGKFGSSFFPYKTMMNNGRSFPYTIEVTSLSSESATLSFTKNA